MRACYSGIRTGREASKACLQLRAPVSGLHGCQLLLSFFRSRGPCRPCARGAGAAVAPGVGGGRVETAHASVSQCGGWSLRPGVGGRAGPSRGLAPGPAGTTSPPCPCTGSGSGPPLKDPVVGAGARLVTLDFGRPAPSSPPAPDRRGRSQRDGSVELAGWGGRTARLPPRHLPAWPPASVSPPASGTRCRMSPACSGH